MTCDLYVNISAFRLEAFNSVILHNLSDNPNLIYGILTAHKTFEDLGTFTLSRGLREIRRVQLAKEELARNNDGKLKDKGPADETGEEEPLAEKAKLLESEQRGENDLATLEEGTRQPETRDGARGPEENSPTQPLVSPTSEELPSLAGSASTVSEKAKGKRKAPRSMSMDTTGSLERIAAAGVGKNGFVPTQEWVCFMNDPFTFIKTDSPLRSLLGNKGEGWLRQFCSMCDSPFLQIASGLCYAGHFGIIAESPRTASCSSQAEPNIYYYGSPSQHHFDACPAPRSATDTQEVYCEFYICLFLEFFFDAGHFASGLMHPLSG